MVKEELDCIRSQRMLQHVVKFLPAGALFGSGSALGLRQNNHLLTVIISIWVISAITIAATSRAALMAGNFGRIAIMFAFLSLLHILLSHSKNEPLKDEVISWLRVYIMITSVAAIVVMATQNPSNPDPQLEPLLVERTNPRASEAKLQEKLLGLVEKPTLDVLPFTARQNTLSDTGSVAFGNMGPSSTCPSNSSEGSNMSLQPTGRVKSRLSKRMVRILSILHPARSSSDDGSS